MNKTANRCGCTHTHTHTHVYVHLIKLGAKEEVESN